MLMSKTPLRISFFGGGSDLPAYYESHHGIHHEFYKNQGAVVSTTIDKYIYINVKSKFDDLIRLSYSQTETVASVDEIKHDLVKATLSLLNVNKSIEITSISDLPSRGTGMGSSSAYLVGLLNALHHFKNTPITQKELAETACKIELDILKKPIGKQDQYIAAYGGFNRFKFNGYISTPVEVHPIQCSQSTIHELERNILLMYTNTTRAAESILSQQSLDTKKSKDTRSQIAEMVDMANLFYAQLNNDNVSEVGKMLHDAWKIKSTLTKGISNEYINHCYDLGLANGAMGGKLLGAGGGGFLMFYAYPDAHKRIQEALPDLRGVHVRFDPKGSRIVYSE